MPVYCVSYDLDEDGLQDYPGLLAELKRFPAYCHAQLSVWFIATEQGTRDVLARLKPHLDDEDKLMVVVVRRSWWLNRKFHPIDGESTEPGTVGDWLRRWLV